MPSTNGGGNSRKIGRNKTDCERYARESRLIKNTAKKAARHIKRMAAKTARRIVWEAKKKAKRPMFSEAA